MAIGTTAALVLGGAALAKGGMSYMSARAKRNAEQKAAGSAAVINNNAKSEAGNYINAGYDQAEQNIPQYGEWARGALTTGRNDSMSSLTSGRDKARGDLTAGFDQGRADTTAGYGDAISRLQPMANLRHYGEDALTGNGFETSGGYNFRLGQGQSALDRMGAASGGRLSGAALKKASEYNQGFASNEYGNWASRAAHLGDVGYNATTGQSGLMADRGNALSGLSVARGGALGQLESNYGSAMSGLNERYGTNISNSLGQQGTTMANLATGRGGAMSNLATNNANANSQLAFAGANGAGAGYDAMGNFIGDMGQIGAIYDWSGGGSTPGAGQMSNTIKPKPIGF